MKANGTQKFWRMEGAINGGLNMKVMQSFLMFFYILDQCYELCEEDDLGGFLGTISPELWKDGKPIDESVIMDWQKVCHPKTVNNSNIISKIYDFLSYYEKKFGFDFSKTKQLLFTLNNQSVIETALEKTQEMYLRFDYVN